MRRVVRRISGGAIACLAIACGGGSHKGSSAASAESDASVVRVCAAACAARDRCAHLSDQERCAPACRENPRIQRLRFARADVIDRTIACIDGPDCEPSEEGHTRGQRCVAHVLRETQPGERVTLACRRLEEYVARCGGNIRGSRSCLDRMKVMNDEFVDQVIACTDEPCKAAARCLLAASERISD